MSLEQISEVCYSCSHCLVVKQICQLQNKPIMNIYRDKCDRYFQRKLYKCELCGTHVIELPQHVKNHHNKTMSEYRILIQNTETKSIKLRRRSLWE